MTELAVVSNRRLGPKESSQRWLPVRKSWCLPTVCRSSGRYRRRSGRYAGSPIPAPVDSAGGPVDIRRLRCPAPVDDAGGPVDTRGLRFPTPVDNGRGPVDTRGLRFRTPVDNAEVRSISGVSGSQLRSITPGVRSIRGTSDSELRSITAGVRSICGVSDSQLRSISATSGRYVGSRAPAPVDNRRGPVDTRGLQFPAPVDSAGGPVDIRGRLRRRGGWGSRRARRGAPRVPTGGRRSKPGASSCRCGGCCSKPCATYAARSAARAG